MANLKERLLSLIDNSAKNAVDFLNTMNETMNAIDWDAQFGQLQSVKDSVLKKGSDLYAEFNDLMKQIKNSINDFEVSVPFDKAVGEKLDYKVEDGKLSIEVSFEDENTTRCNKTTVAIPQNCDVENISTKYNAVTKTMTIIIPKVVSESSEQKIAGFKLKHTSSANTEDENAHTTESKILRKFRENSIPRAANGRFIRRTPKTNEEA